MSRRQTKAELEQIIGMQYNNLSAMNVLLRTMQEQNELIKQVNEKLTNELNGVKRKLYPIPKRIKNSKIP